MLKNIASYVLDNIPRSDLLHKIAKRYVARYNNDNNIEFATNGEARLLRLALENCSKEGGGVIFDVGANIGDWSRYSLSLAPQAEIHLFEPSMVTYKELSKNAWPQNVHINNFGLGETDEVLTLHIFGEKSGLNSLYARRGIGENIVVGTEQIVIRTLDGYCSELGIRKIDFMKVDVEGHELSVLKGAKEMLAAGAVSMIQFEYGGCNLDSRVHLGDIWDFLSKYGYRLAKIYPDRLHYYNVYSQQLETFQYSNWVAVYGNGRE